MSEVAAVGENLAFTASATPSLVLDRHLVIRAVNRAHTRLTGINAADLIGCPVFEAFPDNASNPECDGVANLSASLNRVFETGTRHDMVVQRYDVRDSDGVFVPRWWSPVNSPLKDGGRTFAVLHQVEELPRTLLASTRAAASPGIYPSPAELGALLRSWAKTTDEIAGLRCAMISRAAIEQAKGILMSERQCDADDAFAALVRMSRDSNVRLTDVARAVVYRVQRAQSRPER